MIKIEHPDLVNISNEYFEKIKSHCKSRASFYQVILNVLFNGAPTIDLDNFNLHGNTRKSLCNLLLTDGNKLEDLSNFNTVAIGNCRPWVNQFGAMMQQIADYLNNDDNLRNLILVQPENSYEVNQNLIAHFGINARNQKTIYPFINKIIDYSLFDNHSYWLGKKLGMNTCPYCNRSYIHTIINRNNQEIVRPQFDHFYPQSKSPFLALSFYNLIPSCYYCNSSLKSATSITPDTHLHPYLDGYNDDVRFKIIIAANNPNKSDPENYSIWLEEFISKVNPKYRKILGNNLNEGNVNLFKLNDIFLSHRDIVGELIVKCDKYSGGYANSLHKIFGLLNTNKSEFYKYYFGNYLNNKDFHRRPLAKMTYDIIKQILPEFLK
jgi:hypothetical protein